MNDTTTLAADGIAHDDHAAHAHASDKDYVMVALGLAVLTAIEVVLSYVHALKGIYLVLPLLIVMAIKFVIVGSRFMHLKFDDNLLKRVFYAGLVLAVAVYIAALTTFHIFDTQRCPDGGHRANQHAACVL